MVPFVSTAEHDFRRVRRGDRSRMTTLAMREKERSLLPESEGGRPWSHAAGRLARFAAPYTQSKINSAFCILHSCHYPPPRNALKPFKRRVPGRGYCGEKWRDRRKSKLPCGAPPAPRNPHTNEYTDCATPKRAAPAQPLRPGVTARPARPLTRACKQPPRATLRALRGARGIIRRRAPPCLHYQSAHCAPPELKPRRAALRWGVTRAARATLARASNGLAALATWRAPILSKRPLRVARIDLTGNRTMNAYN